MALYTYLFLYNDDVGSHQEIRNLIDSRPEFVNWYYCIPNSYFIVSGLTATEISDIISEFSGKRGRFIVLDTATDRNGLLPKRAWELMRTPAPPG